MKWFGVLIRIFVGADTEKFYTEVQEIILARFNKTFDWSLKAKMMGKKAIEAARIFVEETGISDSLTAEQFLVERESMLQSLFPTSELMPGFVYSIVKLMCLVVVTQTWTYINLYIVTLFTFVRKIILKKCWSRQCAMDSLSWFYGFFIQIFMLILE